MPLSSELLGWLDDAAEDLAASVGTPFYLYDERGIDDCLGRLLAAFEPTRVREFFAVKALPNPVILRCLHEHGCGFECSSPAEVRLSRMAGADVGDILYSANNVMPSELADAYASGYRIVFDDVRLLEKMDEVPSLTILRVQPASDDATGLLFEGAGATKFGIPSGQLRKAVDLARSRGAKSIGLHGMFCSNERVAARLLDSLRWLLELAARLEDTGVSVPLIDIGGGFGIPYRHEESELAVEELGAGAQQVLSDHAGRTGCEVELLLEAGRYITGPNGVLVTRIINRMRKGSSFVGVDASTNALLRPAIYSHAYHEVSVIGERSGEPAVVDVVGSLCEDSDRLARVRTLAGAEEGALLAIHDAGAHCLAMGFTYNGRLRPPELLRRCDGRVELIRRRETFADYAATLDVESAIISPASVVDAMAS
jgi:diaminopimelate decarboxylase